MLYIMLGTDPSPLVQAVVYMGGMLVGYLLLTEPEEWARARQSMRDALTRRRSR